MPTIIFNTAAGARVEVEAEVGETVMLAATLGDVPGIEAQCGGGASCGTCHVKVRSDWAGVAGSANGLEADMLEALDNADERSRLSCQISITDELDGLVVDVVEF